MSQLATIITAPRMLPPRVLLYGPHGIGKTTFGAKADAPIIIQTEEGADTLNVPRFTLCKTYAELEGAITTLYNEAHPYQTLVLDSIDWLEPLVHARTCDKGGKKNVEDFGYGKGYQFADEIWRDVLGGFDALRRDKGMSIILLGHAEIKRFDDPQAVSYDRYQPKLHKLANALIQEWCDAILFANYRTVVIEQEVGFNKERARGIGSGERIVNTQERPAWIAKNRYNLPLELPLSWAAFVQALSASFAQPA
jgi:hypothetical protein